MTAHLCGAALPLEGFAAEDPPQMGPGASARTSPSSGRGPLGGDAHPRSAADSTDALREKSRGGGAGHRKHAREGRGCARLGSLTLTARRHRPCDGSTRQGSPGAPADTGSFVRRGRAGGGGGAHLCSHCLLDFAQVLFHLAQPKPAHAGDRRTSARRRPVARRRRARARWAPHRASSAPAPQRATLRALPGAVTRRTTAQRTK